MSTASIYEGGRTLVPVVNSVANIVRQRFNVNVEGQTLFNLTLFNYAPDTGTLFVFINGVIQTYALDYLETSSTSFTLNVGINVGDTVLAVAFGINGTVNPVSNDAFSIVTDFPSVQAAVAGTLGFVHFPIGEYETTNIAVTNAGAGIKGEGNANSTIAAGTLLRSTSTNFAMIYVDGADGFSISDLTIAGAYVANTPGSSSPSLIDISGSTSAVEMKNMRMINGAIAIRINNTFYVRMSNISTANFSGTAVIHCYQAAEGEGTGVEIISCSISPGSTNDATDCFRQDGPGGSHKFIASSFLFGARGIHITGAEPDEAGFFYFTGGGMENQDLENIRATAANHIQIGTAYFSNGGDANNFWFGDDVNDVQIGATYLRGAGRSGIYFNGNNLSLAGTSIYNCGRYVNPAIGYHTINFVSGPSGPGGPVNIGAVPVNNGGSIRQQNFVTGDWVVVEGDTAIPSSINGIWKVTVVGTNIFRLEGAVYSTAPAGPFTLRTFSACVQIGPDANKVNIAACQLGRAVDGLARHDYCMLIESEKEVKWALDCLYTPGTYGILKYTPNNPPDGCHDWSDRKSTRTFTVSGALSNTYLMEYITPGLYAISAVAVVTAGGLATIRASYQNADLSYAETSGVFATTTFEETVFTAPLLVRVGVEAEGTAIKVGVRVIASGDSDLTATITIIRLM